MPLPELAVNRIEPQPQYLHVRTLPHETALMSEVVFTLQRDRPGVGYLSIMLDDDGVRAQRLLYVPWEREFTDSLQTSTNPLGDILAEVGRIGQDVVISQWQTDENDSDRTFYRVRATDLLAAYGLLRPAY